MNADHMEELLLAERAAEWLHRLRTGGPREQVAFTRWLKKSPRHVRETLLATTWDKLLRHTDPDHQIDVGALAAQSSGNVIPMQTVRPDEAGGLHGHSTSSTRNRRLWKIAAAFSMVTLAALLTLMLKALWFDHVVMTDASEWQTRTLADGSIVRLGPRTRVRVAFGDQRRLIHLSRGEAIFEVSKDPLRPFLVDADVAVVRAIGTEFGVSRAIDKIVVTVAEGVVEVSQIGRPPIPKRGHATSGKARLASVTVTAGEQVAVKGASPLTVRLVDAKSELAWGNGLLIFQGVTAAEAVSEFNRRNHTQIQIADPRLAARRVYGQFRAADPRAFVNFLEASTRGLILRQRPGILRLEPRRSSADRGASSSDLVTLKTWLACLGVSWKTFSSAVGALPCRA